MANRSGPFKTLRSAAVFAANSTWYECTNSIRIGSQANTLVIYADSAVASPGNVDFYIKHSPDNDATAGGGTFYTLTSGGETPEVFGPLAFTGASQSYSCVIPGMMPLEDVKVFFRCSAGATSATLAIRALSYLDESGISNAEVSIGDIEVDAAAMEALLTTIDADTGNIATNTTDLPNVIGTDGAAGPTKVLSVGGTQATGEIEEIRVDADGHPQVDVLTLPGGLVGYAEDAAHTTADIGIQMLSVRADNPDTTTDADGDYQPLLTDEHGCLHTVAQRSEIIDACNATTGWSVLSDDTDNLTTATNHVYGTASLSFDKVDGAGNTVFAGIQKTLGAAVNLNEYIDHSLGFFMGSVYIPDLTNVAYAWFRAGTDASNYNEWRVDDDNLTAAQWMALRGNLGAPYVSVGNGWNSSAVAWIAIGLAFDAEANTLAGILVDKIQANSGFQVSADITSNTNVNTPNINLHRVGGQPTNTGAGNVGNATQRVTIATDDANLAIISGDTTSLDAKQPALGTALMAASSPVTLATDDTLTVAANALLTTIDADTSTIAGDTTSIDGKTPALGTAVMTGAVPVTLATDDTLTVAANALLTTIDADTSTIAGDTTSIDGKTPALGTAAMVGSSPVTIATDDTVLSATNALLTTIDADTSKIPSLGTAVMTGSAPVTLATDDTQFGAVGAAADVDGNIHGQLRSIGEAVESLATKAAYAPVVTNASDGESQELIATSFAPAYDFQLENVTIKLSGSMAAAETITITLNANDGSNYDCVLKSWTPASQGNPTSLIFLPESPIVCEQGDAIDVASSANVNSIVYGLRIVARRI